MESSLRLTSSPDFFLKRHGAVGDYCTAGFLPSLCRSRVMGGCGGTYTPGPLVSNDQTLPMLAASSGECQKLKWQPQQLMFPIERVTSRARAKRETRSFLRHPGLAQAFGQPVVLGEKGRIVGYRLHIGLEFRNRSDRRFLERKVTLEPFAGLRFLSI